MKIKVVLLFLSFLALQSCGTCHPHPYVSHDIPIKKQQFPTRSFVKILSGVNVKCKTKEGCASGWHFWTGSGAAIASDGDGSLVLTAGHVCHNPPDEKIGKAIQSDISVIDYRSLRRKAHIIDYVHEGQDDLCLLYVPGLFLPRLELSKRSPLPGDRVYNMSAPGGRYHAPHPLLLEGLFSGDIYDGRSALVSIPSIGGVSGSPVLNSNMQLIGIIYATNLQFRFETLATSYNNTIIFLNRALKKHIHNKSK